MDSTVYLYTDFDTLRILVATGADLNKEDSNGHSIFRAVVQEEDVRSVEFLLKHDIDRASKKAAFLDAASIGNTSIIELLLKNDETLLDSSNPHGKTSLMFALENRKLSAVELLLNADTKNVLLPMTDRYGYTALYYARYRTEVFATVMRANAKKVHAGFDSIVDARHMDNSDIITYVIEDTYAEPNLRLILQAKSKRLTTEPLKILTQAINYKSIGCLNVLLEHGLDLNLRDDDGNTPLMTAAKVGNAAIVRLLLKKGADPYQIRNDGETALSLAKKMKHRSVIEILQEA